ncbi:hypothetical protein Q9966_012177 [Columba livia]|nr:hypothetical protein Q9966_012177 [Columba livia]
MIGFAILPSSLKKVAEVSIGDDVFQQTKDVGKDDVVSMQISPNLVQVLATSSDCIPNALPPEIILCRVLLSTVAPNAGIQCVCLHR